MGYGELIGGEAVESLHEICLAISASFSRNAASASPLWIPSRVRNASRSCSTLTHYACTPQLEVHWIHAHGRMHMHMVCEPLCRSLVREESCRSSSPRTRSTSALTSASEPT